MIKNSPKMSSKIDKIDEQRLSETILFFDVVFFIFLIDFGFILGSISDHSWVKNAHFSVPGGLGGRWGVLLGTFGRFWAILDVFGVDLGSIWVLWVRFLGYVWKVFLVGGRGVCLISFAFPLFRFLLACLSMLDIWDRMLGKAWKN